MGRNTIRNAIDENGLLLWKCPRVDATLEVDIDDNEISSDQDGTVSIR